MYISIFLLVSVALATASSVETSDYRAPLPYDLNSSFVESPDSASSEYGVLPRATSIRPSSYTISTILTTGTSGVPSRFQPSPMFIVPTDSATISQYSTTSRSSQTSVGISSIYTVLNSYALPSGNTKQTVLNAFSSSISPSTSSSTSTPGFPVEYNSSSHSSTSLMRSTSLPLNSDLSYPTNRYHQRPQSLKFRSSFAAASFLHSTSSLVVRPATGTAYTPPLQPSAFNTISDHQALNGATSARMLSSYDKSGNTSIVSPTDTSSISTVTISSTSTLLVTSVITTYVPRSTTIYEQSDSTPYTTFSSMTVYTTSDITTQPTTYIAVGASVSSGLDLQPSFHSSSGALESSYVPPILAGLSQCTVSSALYKTSNSREASQSAASTQSSVMTSEKPPNDVLIVAGPVQTTSLCGASASTFTKLSYMAPDLADGSSSIISTQAQARSDSSQSDCRSPSTHTITVTEKVTAVATECSTTCDSASYGTSRSLVQSSGGLYDQSTHLLGTGVSSSKPSLHTMPLAIDARPSEWRSMASASASLIPSSLRGLLTAVPR
nr:hypothetical protein CFP56_72816 [Quercus suber]